MEENAYVATNYTAPRVLHVVSNMLSFTRFAGSRNFADLVSPNYNDRKDYMYSFTVFVSVMASLLFVWAVALIILKYEGERVGCASGRPFHVTKEQTTAQSSSSTIIDLDSSIDSTSDVELLDEQRSTNESLKGTSEDRIKVIMRRQGRTRIAFFVSGLVVLVCAVLLLLFSFSSIRQSTKKADELFGVSQDLIDQVKTSVNTVMSASDYANETFTSTSWDFNEICPNFTSTESLGVDLKDLTAVLGTEFNKLQSMMISNMTNINQTLSMVQDTLDKIQGATEKADEKLWIFAAVVLLIFVVTAAVLVTAVLIWTGKSRVSFEKRITYGVLPFLIIVAVMCWILAAVAAISTLVSADACVGNPDATVQAILREHNVAINSTTSQFITLFTNGCRGQDPTIELTKFGDELRTTIDSMWRNISLADSIGRDELALRCGNSVEGILDAARNLALSLTWTRKALISAFESLQCAPINDIYIEAIYGSFCTDSAQGLAWAFVLFFVVAFGGMTMVSTRACLCMQVREVEVYDESEVAENMILNEHEEYLAYISKYKHEWEEYGGINARSLENSQCSDDNSIRSAEGDSERDEDEILVDAAETWSAGSSELLESESDHDYESDYGSIDSTPSEDISFLSLGQHPTSVDEKVDPLAIPSMLGAPPQNEAWDQEPVFFPIVVPLSTSGPSIKGGKGNLEGHRPTSASPDASRNDQNTPRAGNTRDNTTTNRDDNLMDDDAVYRSLYYIQSTAAENAGSEEWCPSFGESRTNNEEIEVCLSTSAVRASNFESNFSPRLEQKITRNTCSASLEALDNLKYYSRNELPSPKVSRRNIITKASPKMRMVVGKFEI